MFDVLMGNIGIARELFGEDNDRRKGSGTLGSGNATQADVALFFVSYTLINAVMMMNVVVAVLCDGFVQQVAKTQEEEERIEIAEQERRKVKGCLDAMTQVLTTFEDMSDLESKIHTLYEDLDEDNSGGLSYSEFRHMAMQLISTVSLTRDDWNIITENGKHLGPGGEFNKEQFLDMMKGELLRYSRRQLHNVLTVTGDEQFRSVILMLKLFEADNKASLDRQQRSLAQQQLSLAKHEDKLARMQQDIQTVLQLLQGGSNGRPGCTGMNHIDVGSPKAFSADFPKISESKVLGVDIGFTVGVEDAMPPFRHSLGRVPTSSVDRIFETEILEEDEEQTMPTNVYVGGMPPTNVYVGDNSACANLTSRDSTSDTGPLHSSLRGTQDGNVPGHSGRHSIEFRPLDEVAVIGCSGTHEGVKSTDTFKFGSAVIVHPYLTSYGRTASASLGRVVGYDFNEGKWSVASVDVWGIQSEGLSYKCGDELTLVNEREVFSEPTLKAAKQAMLVAKEAGEDQTGKLHAEFSRVLSTVIERRNHV